MDATITIAETGVAQALLATRPNLGTATLTADLANAASIFVGDGGSQSTELEAGDSMSLEGQDLQTVYVRGTAGDSVQLFGVGG